MNLRGAPKQIPNMSNLTKQIPREHCPISLSLSLAGYKHAHANSDDNFIISSSTHQQIHLLDYAHVHQLALTPTCQSLTLTLCVDSVSLWPTRSLPHRRLVLRSQAVGVKRTGDSPSRGNQQVPGHRAPSLVRACARTQICEEPFAGMCSG